MSSRNAPISASQCRTLTRKYAELAHGRRANGEEDEPTPGEDDRDAHHPMTAATAMRAPLFKVSNHHCRRP